MMIVTILLSLLIFFLEQRIVVDAIQAVDFKTTCSATEYFDISSLECKSCTLDAGADGRIPNNNNLDVYGNALSCRCQSGYKKIPANCPVTLGGQCEGFTCSICSIENTDGNSTTTAAYWVSSLNLGPCQKIIQSASRVI